MMEWASSRTIYEITCKCGMHYKSHMYSIYKNNENYHVTNTPCLECGSDLKVDNFKFAEK